MNVTKTRGRANGKLLGMQSEISKLLTFFDSSKEAAFHNRDITELFVLVMFKFLFFNGKPRGVRSQKIRQKERLVRYETPPSAAGGGTPKENMREKLRQRNRMKLNRK